MTAAGIPVAAFERVPACWVCGGDDLERWCAARLDFAEYASQDPELHAYTGEQVWMVKCRACGFGQPEALPILERFFDRMYDQHWSAEWIEQEFEAPYKDLIFERILGELDRRATTTKRRLVDVGAHAGRFMHLAKARGWLVEGIELNARTAAFAAARTGAPVHRVNAHALALAGKHYDAVVLTDVLEHIPEPVRLLADLAALLAPCGVLTLKVPNGPAQWSKEQWLARCTSHRPSLADNLVHVNQFTPGSLRLALECAGFSRISVATAPPELPPGRSLRGVLDRAVRRAVYAAASLPGAVETPLALHLQAFASRDPQ